MWVKIVASYLLVPSLLIGWIFACLYRSGRTAQIAIFCATFISPVIVWLWIYCFAYYFGPDITFKYKEYVAFFVMFLTFIAAKVRSGHSKYTKGANVYLDIFKDLIFFVVFISGVGAFAMIAVVCVFVIGYFAILLGG